MLDECGNFYLFFLLFIFYQLLLVTFSFFIYLFISIYYFYVLFKTRDECFIRNFISDNVRITILYSSCHFVYERIFNIDVG